MSKSFKILSHSGLLWSTKVLSQVPCKSCRSKATLIGGPSTASKIFDRLSGDLQQLKKIDVVPKIVPLVVGDNPESNIYIKNKVKAAAKAGLNCEVQSFSCEISQFELLERIETLNNDQNVHGIIVQLPLPNHIDEHIVCNAVRQTKDVDGFTSWSLGRMVQEVETTEKFSFVPCTPLAVLKILRYDVDMDLKGLNACVVGRSHNVGMPIAMLLTHDATKGGLDLTTTICHRYTPAGELTKVIRNSDVIVTAAGVPGLVIPEMVKPGCIVIDVGFNATLDKNTGKRKLVGDVHPNVADIAGWMTPVPGGVGPCTVACLMHNTVLAAKYIAQEK